MLKIQYYNQKMQYSIYTLEISVIKILQNNKINIMVYNNYDLPFNLIILAFI